MTALSYQLYSSRNFPPTRQTLKLLADTGYTQVEGFGGLIADLDDPGELRADMDAFGLSMPTTHIGLDAVEDTPDDVIALASTLGVKALFVPHLAAELRPDTADGWRAFGARLTKAGAPLRAAGLTFGWHNHDFEFEPGADAHPIDFILEGGGVDLAFEFDVAWCVRAGADPFPVIERYKDRLVSAHVKDIAPEGECLDEDGWADVGHGTMDWPAMIAALRGAGCEYFVMEHDNPNDATRFAQRSFASVSAM